MMQFLTGNLCMYANDAVYGHAVILKHIYANMRNFHANKNLYATICMSTFSRMCLESYQIDVCIIWNYVYVDM